MSLGIMVRGDNTGLGNQTRNLTYMLNPSKIFYVNSTFFSKNKEQHLDWYKGYKGLHSNGFPTDVGVRKFMQNLTHFLCVENPHNFLFFELGQKYGIKTYCQTNYEFCDNLKNPDLPLPTKFLMPSFWKLEEMKKRFGDDRVVYLPPPLDEQDFADVRAINYNRTGKRKFLHIVGILASHDRNGTLDLLQALKHTKADFELDIRSQQPLPSEYIVDDKRVRYLSGSTTTPDELYSDYDALILPRRYAGLCLPCNEALMAGLPVIMTDISPNNQLLPKEWVVEAHYDTTFIARVPIEVFKSNYKALASKIDWLCETGIVKEKEKAFELGFNTFDKSKLLAKYMEVFE